MAETKFMKLPDLNFEVEIKICSLLGHPAIDKLELMAAQEYSAVTSSSDTESYVTCQIYANGRGLSLEQSTTYKSFPTNVIKWNETIVFPIKYRDLTPTTTIAFTVWEVCHTSQLHSPLSLDPHISLPVSPTKSFYGNSIVYNPSQEARVLGGTTVPVFSKRGCLKSGRRSLLLWSGKRGDGQVKSTTPYKISEAKGLDKLEKLIRINNMKDRPKIDWLDKLAGRRIEQIRYATSKKKHSSVAPIAHEEMLLTVELFPRFNHPAVFQAQTCNQALPQILPLIEPTRLFVLHDPEMRRSNPAEDKYQKLAQATGAKHIRPRREARTRINKIIASPNKVLRREEKELLWTYRFTLHSNKHALTKFLRCVDWEKTANKKEAIEMLKTWEEIDAVDALELLSDGFRNPDIREYAVGRLEKVDDQELNLYLLQLVQALRYEPAEEKKAKLAEFLISRASKSLELANFLHWFLMVEKKMETKEKDKDDSAMFAKLHDTFLNKLKENEETKEWYTNITGESKLVEDLITLGKEALDPGGKFVEKKKRFKDLVRKGGKMHHLSKFEHPITCPTRPEIILVGIDIEKSTMFKSAMCPLLVAFHTANGKTEKIIFKDGDDLRQDQLIMQMINLMDMIMKKVNLDLKLKPYKILATAPENGFLEYIGNSINMGDALKNNGNKLKNYFESLELKPSKLQDALETFVKSCAGYSVITYLLGIGDRHLDNILMTRQGHMFHIDFGWAFGSDPKPFPPPMKFTKEMVMAMGGPQSARYRDFQRFCCLAFNILRKHSELILNLLSLMRDASIPHLIKDGVDQNLEKVKANFVLDKTEEEAENILLNLINQSVSAMFPTLIDFFHDFAQNMR